MGNIDSLLPAKESETECVCVQKHIKMLWQHRITGKAFKAVLHAPFISAALRLVCVCTLRGLPLRVSPSAVNSGMIRHRYTVG